MSDEILNVNDGTPNVRAGSLGGASMRYHELAVQLWLNSLFFVREGYPIPVVFTSPMDAFSAFQQLWADENNPFSYLFNLKDKNGTPLYAPYPSPVRYPVISVHRKGWKYRQYQNFSIHRWRHINWPTVANAGTEVYGPQADGWDIHKCGLGNVTTSRMPMAWDYKFQIDHFCNRPDTQAFFVEQLMQTFWRTGGTTPQTWINVPYPGWGNRRVRLFLEGDIESMTPEEPEEGKNVEFRTSFTIVVEGFDIDLRYEIYPALWKIIMRMGAVAPIELEDAVYLTKTVDVRIDGKNPSIDVRPNVPSWGTCVEDLEALETDQTEIQVTGLNETANNQFGLFTIVAESPQVVVQGTDYAAQSQSFVYGGIELYVNTSNGVQTTAFSDGTLRDTILVLSDTGSGGVQTSFVAGAALETTLLVSAISAGSAQTALVDGVLSTVVFETGILAANGSNSTVFESGILNTVILVTGTWFDYTGQSTGFLSGALV